MHLALNTSRVNHLFVGLVLVIFSFTEITVMQVGKAVITPFHFVVLGLVIPLLITNPAAIKADKLLLGLLAYILLVNAINFKGIRTSSFIYTLVFIIEFIMIMAIAKNIKANALKRFFQVILILYFINLCVTTLLIASGLYNLTSGTIFRAYFGMRPMGFSSEPSYAAFIVTIAFVCINELKFWKDQRNSWTYYLLYFGCIILTTSAYGIIYACLYTMVMLWRVIRSYSTQMRVIIVSVIATISIIGLLLLAADGGSPVTRAMKVAAVLVSDMPLTDKIDEIGIEDASAWGRIGPSWLLFQNGNIGDLIFGHGSGSSGQYFFDQLVGILVNSDREYVDLGIIPGFLYEFGFIGFFLLLSLLFRLLRSNKLFFLLLISFFVNAGINTQIFWFALTCFSLVAIQVRTNISPSLTNLPEMCPGV